jgi:hypothetical protein
VGDEANLQCQSLDLDRNVHIIFYRQSASPSLGALREI